jgi:hypothetical protein
MKNSKSEIRKTTELEFHDRNKYLNKVIMKRINNISCKSKLWQKFQVFEKLKKSRGGL